MTKRWVAAAVAAALLLGVPGLDFYAAVAQVVAVPAEAPLVGASAGSVPGAALIPALGAGRSSLDGIGVLSVGTSGPVRSVSPAAGAAPSASRPLGSTPLGGARIGAAAGAPGLAAGVGAFRSGPVSLAAVSESNRLAAPLSAQDGRRATAGGAGFRIFGEGAGLAGPASRAQEAAASAVRGASEPGISAGESKARQDAFYDRSGGAAEAGGFSVSADPMRAASAVALKPPSAAGVADEPGGLKPGAPPEAPAAAVADDSGGASPAGSSREKTKLPRSLWGLFWGHEILTVFGINFHMLSQPFLVLKTLGKSKSIMGMVRNVHMGSMSIVNLLPVGLLIDKTDFRTLFIATSLARAVLMGAIPLLFLAGHLSFGVLVAIVALNPIFQSTMVTADSAARNAFLGTDEKLNKEAAAVIGKYAALGDMLFPLVAGYVLGILVGHFGLGGYALAYGVYSALLLAAIPFYWLMVRDPRNPAEMGWKGFVDFMRLTGQFLWAIGKALALAPWRLVRAAWRTIFPRLSRGFRLARIAVRRSRSGRRLWPRRGAPARASSPEAPRPGILENIAASLERHEATKGLAYILRNRVLRVLIMAGSIEAFLSDAMPMVVLPNYITDVIGEPAHAVPFLGALLGTAGGVFGLMLAAEQLGHFISSWYMEGDRGDKVIKKFGAGKFYRAAAVSSLLFWLMWLFPAVLAPHAFFVNFAVVMAVQLLTALAHGPVGVVMAPVQRKEIPDGMLGRVTSAFNMVDLFFSAGGALAAGFLLDLVGIKTAMFLIALAVTGTGVMEWMIPKWIFKKPAGGPTTNPAPSAPGAPVPGGSTADPTQNPPPSKNSSEGGKTAWRGSFPGDFASVYA